MRTPHLLDLQEYTFISETDTYHSSNKKQHSNIDLPSFALMILSDLPVTITQSSSWDSNNMNSSTFDVCYITLNILNNKRKP